jgi:hypothetical protein
MRQMIERVACGNQWQTKGLVLRKNSRDVSTERSAYCPIAKSCCSIIQTNEDRPYAIFILKKLLSFHEQFLLRWHSFLFFLLPLREKVDCVTDARQMRGWAADKGSA